MVFKHYTEVAKNIEDQKKVKLYPPKIRRKDSKSISKRNKKASVLKSVSSRARHSTNFSKHHIRSYNTHKHGDRRNGITRFNSEVKKFLKVPTKDSFTSSEQDLTRINSSEMRFSHSSVSNKSLKRMTSDMKPLRLLSQSPILNISNKMRFMNLKPVVLSKSRLENMHKFENEEERSLDDLKTKLLLQYRSQQKAKRNRKRGRNNINLIKSVDQINTIKNKPVLEEPSCSRFSRKSTGVTKASTKKNPLPKITSITKDIWKDSQRFMSPRIAPIPNSILKTHLSRTNLLPKHNPKNP